MKNLKYYGIILLSALMFILPAVFGIAYVYYRQNIYLAGCAVAFVITFILTKPVQSLRIKYRRDVEYDEFGLSKSKGNYERLSKAERDAIDLQKTAEMEKILDSTAIKKMVKEGSKDPEGDMEKLTGLIPVKQKIKEMVARMQFEKKDKKRKDSVLSMSGRHMVFFGSPGTGKTTVARIITGFLYREGYIRKNKCVEIDGNFLKMGAYSAQKTQLVVRQAFGGVLFIDEAYALMYSGDGSAEAAVATLIKEMEDNRDRFILILAGYRDEMRMLLDKNPGFKSRIKEYLDFPDYNAMEMREIFMTMAGEHNLAVSDKALEAFDVRMEKERRLDSFGNARTARNVLDETIDRHALNLMENILSENERYIICEQDVSKNIKVI